MLFILEIVFLVAGAWALVTGRLPSWLLGGPGYVIEGAGARILGAILVLPLPLNFGLGILLFLLSGENGLATAVYLETGTVLLVAVTALVVSRRVRRRRAGTAVLDPNPK
jgi:hypothetical protein